MALAFVGVPGAAVEVPIVYDPFTRVLGRLAVAVPAIAYMVWVEDTVTGPV